MRTIIFPPIIDWEWMTQRPQQLMKQFARQGCTVYYCNRTTKVGEPDRELVGEPGLFLVYDHDKWMQESYASVRRDASELIVWCTWPALASNLTRYEADRIIYDCVDDFAQWYPQEEEMVKIADAIVCSSGRLDQRLARLYPEKPRLLLRNGYDEDMGLHLSSDSPYRGERPADLPPADKPVIGFIGAWAPWVDAGLLARIAGTRGLGAEVVVIGDTMGRRYELGHVQNLRYLGFKPHHQLPDYLAHLNICLVPFLPQPVTLAANPVKVYEYLAAGKPVVSTDLPECRLMNGIVDVASDHLGIIRLIKRRLEQPGSAAPRRSYAIRNSWRLRAQAGLSWLNTL
ncbi:glycosyltransferase [Paenibacillus daejeonensis]|uniref:glycosyltransferase n=1 Tax=Paenibacillus daejeonensis TaxID=135193 RepID=UPI00035FA672|nr:glycosyltransferase [Paenibacillus daejeonensis]